MIALLALVQQVAEPFRAFEPEDTLFAGVERLLAVRSNTPFPLFFCPA
jgi:hypothetical protein